MLKLINHLLVQERLSKIRRKGIDPAHFRTGVMEIGRLMSYDFANTLEKEFIKIETPMGMARGIKIKNREKIVVISILRASLPLTYGIIRVFPEAEQGMIGAWRHDKPPFDICIDYLKIPDLNDKIVIVADPMLATGNTMEAILKSIKSYGKPNKTILFNLISSNQGLEKMQKFDPDLEIYTCSIEEKVNENGYIIPGLGDAGDISFGKPFNCQINLKK
jgi:uracil phosphoribosyltransferase